jgi:hypothetical protein
VTVALNNKSLARIVSFVHCSWMMLLGAGPVMMVHTDHPQLTFVPLGTQVITNIYWRFYKNTCFCPLSELERDLQSNSEINPDHVIQPVVTLIMVYIAAELAAWFTSY